MDEIYQEELMDIYKDPAHRGTMDDATHHSHGTNPMCGDEVTLQLKIADGRIADVKFHGDACAVSVIASEILSEHIVGKTMQEAMAITKDDLLKMIGINLTTSRVKCATLALNALHNALEGIIDDN
jgi:nitrogen fixation protein NifU and related proteins